MQARKRIHATAEAVWCRQHHFRLEVSSQDHSQTWLPIVFQSMSDATGYPRLLTPGRGSRVIGVLAGRLGGGGRRRLTPPCLQSAAGTARRRLRGMTAESAASSAAAAEAAELLSVLDNKRQAT